MEEEIKIERRMIEKRDGREQRVRLRFRLGKQQENRRENDGRRGKGEGGEEEGTGGWTWRVERKEGTVGKKEGEKRENGGIEE